MFVRDIKNQRDVCGKMMSAGTKRKEINNLSNDVNSSDLDTDSLPKRFKLRAEDCKEWGLDSVVDYLREHEISSDVINAFHGKFTSKFEQHSEVVSLRSMVYQSFVFIATLRVLYLPRSPTNKPLVCIRELADTESERLQYTVASVGVYHGHGVLLNSSSCSGLASWRSARFSRTFCPI